MGEKGEVKIMLSDHVLEVRHAASGSFLDVRGYVADYIRNNGLFPHWKIDNNVVNFRDLPDKIDKEGAFAGYKSAGYIVLNPGTRNYFVDRASAYWRILLKNQHYKLPDPTRFGTRTRVFLPSQNTFDVMNKRVFEFFYTNEARDLIGGRETDVQFVFELVEEQYEVRLSGGPMHEKEVGVHLSFESEHFEKCGFFLDLDYYKNKDISHDTVPRFLKRAIELTWIKIEKIASALGI